MCGDNKELGGIGASRLAADRATPEQSPQAVSALRGGIADAVTIPRELFDFLMGVGEIDGTSFGDLNESLPGRFWWRALLRAAEMQPLTAQPKSRLQRRLVAALSLADDLKEQGHARMAQVIRDLCASARASADLNARLHHDLGEALAQSPRQNISDVLIEALEDAREFISDNFAKGPPDSRTNAGKRIDSIDDALRQAKGGSDAS